MLLLTRSLTVCHYGNTAGAVPAVGDLIVAIGVNNVVVGNNDLVFDKVGVTVVPEPQQVALLTSLGLFVLAGYRRLCR
jgi:hypothetical protein